AKPDSMEKRIALPSIPRFTPASGLRCLTAAGGYFFWVKSIVVTASIRERNPTSRLAKHLGCMVLMPKVPSIHCNCAIVPWVKLSSDYHRDGKTLPPIRSLAQLHLPT